MGWKKRRKEKLVSAILILVLLIVNSISSIMAEELNETGEIPVSQLTEETETQEQTADQINGISGVLWFDENNNGIIDEEETPISDYPIYLYNKENLTEEIHKVNSDTEGKYVFSELEPGEYIVGVKAEENETGYLLPETGVTDDTDNKFAVDEELEALDYAYSRTIAIAEDAFVTDIDGGLLEVAEQTDGGEDDDESVNNNAGQENDQAGGERETSLPEDELETDSGQALDYTVSPTDLEAVVNANSISGAIWMDANEDGIYGDSEKPVAGYEVYLYLASDKNNAIATSTTDSSGEYVFDNITPGEYSVGMPVAETVSGTKFLVPVVGIRGDNKFVLDDYCSVYTEAITVAANTQATNYNAGIRLYDKMRARSSAYTVFLGTEATGTVIGTALSLSGAITVCTGSGYGAVTYTIRLDAPDGDMGTNAAPVSPGYNITLTSATGNNYSIIQTATSTVENDANSRHLRVLGSLTLSNITLEGNGADNNGGVYVVQGAEAELVLKNATITNCNNYNGGGVYCETGSTVTIEEQATIENCHAKNFGGGVYLNTSSVLEMRSNSMIINCSGNAGGGVYGRGSSITMNNATIEECDASSSDSTGGTGGGVMGENNSVITIAEYSRIQLCTATNSGGGVCASLSSLTMDNATIIDCDALNIMGGGVAMLMQTLEIKNGSLIENCTARNEGGGVYGTMATIIMSDNATVRGCRSEIGAGVYASGVIGMPAELEMTSGATIDTCVASSGGGGVYLAAGNMTMDNAYVVNNQTSSGDGGGIYLSTTDAVLTATSGSIRNNMAPSGDGGGIYTIDCEYEDPLTSACYGNVTTTANVVFSENTARYEEEPPSNAESYTQLKFNGTSQLNSPITIEHILNNYDLNYRRDSVTLQYNSNVTSYGSSTDAVSQVWTLPWRYTVTVLAVGDFANFTAPNSNYQFKEWNTKANGSGLTYAPGAPFDIAVDTVLYAQWELITPSLTIEKTVTGKYGDMTKMFEITVTLTDGGDTPLTDPYDYYRSTGETGTLTPENDGTVKFSLGHGESLTIEGIPLDSKYTVEETDSTVGSYTVTYDGSESLPTGILTGGNVKVAIENNFDFIKTGIGGLDTRMIIVGLVALFVFAAAIVIFSRRRRKS